MDKLFLNSVCRTHDIEEVTPYTLTAGELIDKLNEAIENDIISRQTEIIFAKSNEYSCSFGELELNDISVGEQYEESIGIDDIL